MATDKELWGDISDSDLNEYIDDIEDIVKETELNYNRAVASRDAPLYNLRYGTLFVTDLVAQTWCEQQLWYKLSPETDLVAEPEPVKIGKSIHLARELESQDRIRVITKTREDIFAIKLINIISCFQGFLQGTATSFREIPIFGFPFDTDVYVTGIIDELKFDQDTYQIDVYELKTRSSKSILSQAQIEKNEMQVMLYKVLFDDLISSRVRKCDIIKHTQYDLNKILSEDVINNTPIVPGTPSLNTLDKLLDCMFNMGAALPRICQMFIEYCDQKSSDSNYMEVEHKANWLELKLKRGMEFWKGSRKPEGVSIEETWKCRYCDYVDICDWRRKKQNELVEGKKDM